MAIPSTAFVLVSVAILGAAIALAAFTWAVRHGHLDYTNTAASSIFDESEPAGVPTDQIFQSAKREDVA